MKRLLTLVLSALMLLTSFAFVGCFGGGGEADEEGKIQLQVGYSTAGFGDSYYKWLKQEFEEAYPDVQVKLNDRTNAVAGGDAAISGLPDDVLFEGFSDTKMYIGQMTEITDIYTSLAYDDNFNFVGRGQGSKTLLDRLDKNERAMLNYNEAATQESQYKFYGAPLYTGMYGWWYDVDLFEQNGGELYDYEEIGYAGLDCEVGTADDGYGPDGVPNTYDDRLPATFEDFKLLCYFMVDHNLALYPFIWTSQHQWMQYKVAETVKMSYDGFSNYAIHSTFDGTYVFPDGTTSVITPETGHKLWTVDENGDMPYKWGEKASLLWSEFIADNTLYDPAITRSTSHTMAQTLFLTSKTVGARNAFLMEGSHWQAEASLTFNEMAGDNPADALDERKFAILPIPKFIGTDGVPDQHSMNNVIPMNGGGVGITMMSYAKGADGTGRIDDDTGENVLDIAKDFMLFVNSNESLLHLLQSSRVLPTADVIATEGEKANWNPALKSMLEMVDEANKPNSKSELGYYYGDSACKAVNKPNSYYHAIESAYSSYMFYGSCLEAGKDTRHLYVLGAMSVNASQGIPVSADNWWEGMARYIDIWQMNPAKWAEVLGNVK